MLIRKVSRLSESGGNLRAKSSFSLLEKAGGGLVALLGLLMLALLAAPWF